MFSFDDVIMEWESTADTQASHDKAYMRLLNTGISDKVNESTIA